MKKILLAILIFISLGSYGQTVLTTNNAQTVTNKTLYGTQNTIDSIYAANILNLIDSIEAHAGGGGTTIYTGDGTLAGDRTVTLDGNILYIDQGGNHFLTIDPTTNSESTTLQAFNNTDGGNLGIFNGTTSNTSASALLEASFNASAKDAVVYLSSDASSATITYIADTHTFSGTLILSNYGSGTNTGTPAYNLAVDASGNVIEVAASPSPIMNASYYENNFIQSLKSLNKKQFRQLLKSLRKTETKTL